jgi:hypothetical protein
MLTTPEITCCFKTKENVLNFISHEALRPHARAFSSENVLGKGHVILEDNDLMAFCLCISYT